MMKNKIIFLNGKIMTASSDVITALAPGNVSGQGVFETMRIYKGKVFCLKEHLQRMQMGLHVFGMRNKYSSKKWKQIVQALLDKNKSSDALVRVAQWKNSNKITTCAVLREPQELTQEQFKKGYHVMLSTVQRNRTKYSHVKSIDYALFKLALGEAKEKGCQEAFFFNRHGELVEGTHTNVFIVKRGVLLTPPVHSGCLNGITRQNVMDCAKQMNIPVKVKTIKKISLTKADEIFITNSNIELMPVTRIEGCLVARGKVGKITSGLKTQYSQIVRNRLDLECA